MVSNTRLPQGQEKSGKTKKNEKSQEKIYKNIKFCQFKFTEFLICIQKLSNGKNLIKNSKKSD